MATTHYFTVGTFNKDSDSPGAEFQGMGIACYTKDDDGVWNRVQRDKDGKPSLGYKAQEITAEEAEVWNHRIRNAYLLRNRGGYRDSQGTWFPGNTPASVLLQSAYNEMMEEREAGFYRSSAQKVISELADKFYTKAALRAEEYATRLKEAQNYLADKNSQTSWPYLEMLTFRNITLEEAANLVVQKKKEFDADVAKVAEMRQKKSLLLGPIPMAEKRAVYNEIVVQLQALVASQG